MTDKETFKRLVDSMLATYFDGDKLVQVHRHLVSFASWKDEKKRFVICIECGQQLDKHDR